MNETQSTLPEERVLARRLVRELTDEEASLISGGTWIDTMSGGKADACDVDKQPDA